MQKTKEQMAVKHLSKDQYLSGWRWRAIRIGLVLTLYFVFFIARTAAPSFAKYTYKLDPVVLDVQTEKLLFSHTGNSKIIVYQDGTTIGFDVRNYYLEDPQFINKSDIKFTLSMHGGDELRPNLQQADADFSFALNGEDCGMQDASTIYTLKGGEAQTKHFDLAMHWTGGTMDVSEFVYVKIKVLEPYVYETMFKITLLSRMKIAFDVNDVVDAYSNDVRDLGIMTALSFGADLPFHLMRVELSWDTSLSLDDTHPLVRASINDPLNADSIVLGGSQRKYTIYVPPSAIDHIAFYRNGRAATNNDAILCNVHVMEADASFYNAWDSNDLSNGNQGWKYAPDGAFHRE